MKFKIKERKKKKGIKHLNKMIIVIIVGILFSTIAFAKTTFNLVATGSMSLGLQDGIIITNVSVNQVEPPSSVKTDHYVKTLLTNTVFLSSSTAEAILEVTIKNTDNVKYRFDGILYDPNGNNELGVYSNSNIVPEVVNNAEGISQGTVVNEKETKKIYVKYKYNSTDYTDGNLKGTIKLKFERVYKITYVLNGGMQADNQPTIFTKDDNISLLNPSKEDCSFEGWYDNQSFSGNSISQISGRTSDITLYAKFKSTAIYFQMPPDWYKDDADSDYTVKAYMYNSDNGNYNEPWPGVTMTHITSDDKDIFKLVIDPSSVENYNKIIFSNGKVRPESASSSYENDKVYKQTIDLDFNSNNNFGQVFVPEIYKNPDNKNEVRFFAQNNQNLHYYIWNNASQQNSAGWPGTKITDSVGGALQFKFDKSKFDRMIINRGNGAEQSKNLEIPVSDITFSSTNLFNNNVYYFYVTRTFYGGSWHNYESWLSSEYNTWHEGDYQTFSKTIETLQNINYFIN